VNILSAIGPFRSTSRKVRLGAYLPQAQALCRKLVAEKAPARGKSSFPDRLPASERTMAFHPDRTGAERSREILTVLKANPGAG